MNRRQRAQARAARRMIESVMAGNPLPAAVEVWESAVCAGCGLDVCFLPDQQVNACAHCGTVVIRGLG